MPQNKRLTTACFATFDSLPGPKDRPNCGEFRDEFAPNKKWALSPLISPPAGKPTATQADKLVCILRIRRNAVKFNGERMSSAVAVDEVLKKARSPRKISGRAPGFSSNCARIGIDVACALRHAFEAEVLRKGRVGDDTLRTSERCDSRVAESAFVRKFIL